MTFTKREVYVKALNLLNTTEDGGKIGGVYCTIADLADIMMYASCKDYSKVLPPLGAVEEVLLMCSDYEPYKSSWL